MPSERHDYAYPFRIDQSSREAARAGYNSPEYQANITLRQPHSIAELIVIEGYDGPQP